MQYFEYLGVPEIAQRDANCDSVRMFPTAGRSRSYTESLKPAIGRRREISQIFDSRPFSNVEVDTEIVFISGLRFYQGSNFFFFLCRTKGRLRRFF
jgi:hypothetical protein